MNIKPRIKEWLVRRNKTAKELADHLNVSENRVSEWGKGRGYPRFEKLWKMAKYLNVKMDDLYEETDE